MTRHVLLAMDLGDVEELRVSADDRHLTLESSIDGCESVTILDPDEATRVRDALTAWLAGAR